MSGGYIGLIWMDTDGELMKPVLWSQLRALSLSLSLSLSTLLFHQTILQCKRKVASFFFFVPTDLCCLILQRLICFDLQCSL